MTQRSKRRKALPAVDPQTDRRQRPFLEAVKEILETADGTRGDPLDRKLTVRDLVDAGLAKFRRGAGGDGAGLLPPGGDDVPNLAVPPRPTGFFASGGFGYIVLSWNMPGDSYSNHALTNIYRSREDNFANAVRIGRDAGAFYTDYIRSVADYEGYYYWITYTSDTAVEGPPNSTAGTYAEVIPDVGFLLDNLSEQLSESQLGRRLNARIDLIDGPVTLEGSVAARVAREKEERIGEDNALARSIEQVGTRVGQVDSRVTREQTARDDGDKALARSLDQVSTQFGKRVAAVEQNLETTANRVTGRLDALYTLRITNDGKVAGFGLSNDGSTSRFIIDADQFGVAPSGGATRYPFIVDGNVAYFDSAMFREGSIQEGQLGPITIGKLTDQRGRPITTVAGLIRADAVDTDKLRVAEAATFYGQARSRNYSWQNGAGWLLDPNGAAYFGNGAIFHGAVEFRSGDISGGVTTGGDTLNTIRERAWRGANAKSSVDSWTRPNTSLINGNQIYTGDAYVDTFQIKGNAVTVPASSTSMSELELPDRRWTTVASVWMDPQGAPAIVSFGFQVEGNDSSRSNTPGSARAYMEVRVRLLTPNRHFDLGVAAFTEERSGSSASVSLRQYINGLYTAGGTGNYELQVRRASGVGSSCTVSARTIFAMGVKR